MRGRVVFRFDEDFSPLRISFRPKTVVVEDGPGFLVNRVLGPYLNEAGHLLVESGNIEAIDRRPEGVKGEFIVGGHQNR